MSKSLACPFCRKAISTTTTATVVCANCGESFAPTMALEVETLQRAEVTTKQPTWFKPAMFASCLVSLAIAIGGAFYFLNTKPETVTTPSSERRPGILPPPLALSALTYLPASTHVAAGFSPGPLLVYAEVNNANPTQMITDAGIPKAAWDAIQKLGVPLNQIDHLAVGLTLADDSAVPQVTLVMVLKAALPDDSAFWKGIGAERVSAGDRPKYKATVGGLPVLGVRVTPTVYVLATEASVVEKQTGEKPTSSEHLSASLRNTLANKLSPASFLWVATGSKDNWAKNPSVQLALTASGRKDLLPLISKAKALAICLALEPDPWMRVAVQTNDMDTAQALSDYFGTMLPGEQTEVSVTKDDGAEVRAPCPLKETGVILGKLMPKVK